MSKQVTVYKCPICNRNVQRLASHMRLAHPDQGKAPPEKPKDMNDNSAVIVHNEGAFTKDDLLAAARRPASSAERSAEMDTVDDDIEYRCQNCNAKVARSDKVCPNCHYTFMWSAL